MAAREKFGSINHMHNIQFVQLLDYDYHLHYNQFCQVVNSPTLSYDHTTALYTASKHMHEDIFDQQVIFFQCNPTVS